MGKPVRRRKYFIREWREHREMTLEELGRRIGREKEAVSKMETGKVGLLLENIENIADALGCTKNDLLDRPPTEHPTLFTNYANATEAQRRQMDRMSKAIIDPEET